MRSYKKKRKIINTSYQSQADDIVGKMTIKALDDELESRQEPTSANPALPCRIHTPPNPDTNRLLSFLPARNSVRT